MAELIDNYGTWCYIVETETTPSEIGGVQTFYEVTDKPFMAVVKVSTADDELIADKRQPVVKYLVAVDLDVDIIIGTIFYKENEDRYFEIMTFHSETPRTSRLHMKQFYAKEIFIRAVNV